MLRRALLVPVVLALFGTGLGVIAPGASAAPVVSAAPVGSAQRAVSSAHAVVRRPTGRRIVAIAKRYVGKVRYRNGGETPRQGFDCSGYTKYVYSRAGVARLPHNTEAQRRVHGMRRIAPSRARRSDLLPLGRFGVPRGHLRGPSHAVRRDGAGRGHPLPAGLLESRRVRDRLALIHTGCGVDLAAPRPIVFGPTYNECASISEPELGCVKPAVSRHEAVAR